MLLGSLFLLFSFFPVFLCFGQISACEDSRTLRHRKCGGRAGSLLAASVIISILRYLLNLSCRGSNHMPRTCLFLRLFIAPPPRFPRRLLLLSPWLSHSPSWDSPPTPPHLVLFTPSSCACIVVISMAAHSFLPCRPSPSRCINYESFGHSRLSHPSLCHCHH